MLLKKANVKEKTTLFQRKEASKFKSRVHKGRSRMSVIGLIDPTYTPTKLMKRKKI